MQPVSGGRGEERNGCWGAHLAFSHLVQSGTLVYEMLFVLMLGLPTSVCLILKNPSQINPEVFPFDDSSLYQVDNQY